MLVLLYSIVGNVSNFHKWPQFSSRLLFEDVFKWFTFCLLVVVVVVVVSHPSGMGQLYSEIWAEFSEKLQTALNLHGLQLSAVGRAKTEQIRPAKQLLQLQLS